MEDIRDERREQIMQLQEKISEEKLKDNLGRDFEVIIEGYLPDDDVYVGRTYMDAPDVDGFFYVRSDRQLMTGDIVNALCAGSSQYDLYGDLTV